MFVGLFLGAPSAPFGAEEGEALSPGPARERTIAAGEAHVYRAQVTDASLLVILEQRGIDLVIEARGPTDQSAVKTDANGRWGPEVLLLPASSTGVHRIEVHPVQPGVVPGHYSISVESLPAASGGSERRLAALTAMSRAGQLAATGNAEALREAAAAYREAFVEWHALDERRWEAEALHGLAFMERQSGELKKAAEDYKQTVALWRELGDGHRATAALNGLGQSLLYQGEIDAARKAFESARTLCKDLGERVDEANARFNLCLVDQYRGALPEAIACYKEVQALFHELGDQSQEANIFNSLGGIYNGLGQPVAALEHYGQALTRWKEAGDHLEEARILNNMAVVHRTVGEWQEALRLYGQAQDLLKPLGGPLKETLLNNIGYAYNSLGEPERAQVSFKEVLKLRREATDQRGEIVSLNNIGLTWRSLGDLDQALAHHQQALALAMQLDDPRPEAGTRLRLAEVLLDRADSTAALSELDHAQKLLPEKGNPRDEATALYLRGRALALAGKPQEALPILEDTLARRQALRDRAGEVEALHALAAVEWTLGCRDEARSHAEEAVARVEEMRTGFVSQGLRAAFLATQRRAYALLIDLLMDRHAADPKKGYDREAFAVSEQARARTLLDALWSGNTTHAAGSVPAELLERRRSLRYRLGLKTDQQLRQINTEALERAVEALLTELDSVEAEIHRLAPREAALARPPTLGIQEIAELLDPDTLLLEYSLGEERSYLWAVGADGFFGSFVLPPQQEIEDLGRRVYENLRTTGAGGTDGPDVKESLAHILLEPIWNEVVRGRRLAVVPDAALHILPFSALQVPTPGKDWKDKGFREPLIEQQEVVYVPSAATLAVERQRLAQRPAAPKGAAVFADPVFGANDLGFERLPYSRKEAEAIAGLAPVGGVVTALDLEASRDAVLSGDLRAYRVLHFATHAVADAHNPERSSLVLSLVDAAGHPREGFLGLPDIYELDLGADLVVLSGCETALGKEVRGEGVMGLTRGFLYAGAPRVVASLWRVQDRTTADLMSRFYEGMWRGGLSPAAALREAQLSLRRSDRRYRDPYFWAGYVLQGDWR